MGKPNSAGAGGGGSGGKKGKIISKSSMNNRSSGKKVSKSVKMIASISDRTRGRIIVNKSV